MIAFELGSQILISDEVRAAIGDDAGAVVHDGSASMGAKAPCASGSSPDLAHLRHIEDRCGSGGAVLSKGPVLRLERTG